MVVNALYVGGFVGVALSGAYLYWEIGKFAAPQVPRSLFDERKEVIAYTAGLFLGVPLTVLLLVFYGSLVGGYLLSALAELAVLVAGLELAQWGILRLAYFRSDGSGPFYALGLRAGIGGILILGTVAEYAGSSSLSATGIALTAAQSVALLVLQVGGALLSLPAAANTGRLGRSAYSGALFGGVGLFLVGLAMSLGSFDGIAAAALAAIGGGFVYVRLRDPILKRVRPPPLRTEGRTEEERKGFGRTDR